MSEDGSAPGPVAAPPRSGSSHHSSALHWSGYGNIETLERQYATAVDGTRPQRVMLLVHLNGNACYAGGVQALLQHRNTEPVSSSMFAAEDRTTSSGTTSSTDPSLNGSGGGSSGGGAADPFSFLSQDTSSNAAAAGVTTPTVAEEQGGNKKGFRAIFSKVAQTTTQRLERGMTHLAIRADRGKSPDLLLVALVDVEANYLLGVTESLVVPADEIARNSSGLRFRIPLYVPASAPEHASNLQCQVYLKSGAAALAWQNKPYLVGISPRLSVAQLRKGVAQQPPTQPPIMWTMPLQSNVVVDGKMTVTVLQDPKLPALCGPGWSLADPSVQGYTSSLFDVPLDQSYGLPLTLPVPLSHSLPTAPTTNSTPVPPAPTSMLLCTERTTESAVVLPVATAWFHHLVAPAVKSSFEHATAAAARINYARHDTNTHGSAVETHVTLHALYVATNMVQSVLGHGGHAVHRRVSVHCQRPDSIFEVEWGGGHIVCLPEGPGGAESLPPPATVLAYPKPVRDNILPALAAQPMPTHGYRLGVLRVQVEPTEANTSPVNGPVTSVWEGFLNLDTILQQSGQVQRIPLIVADHPSTVVGHITLTLRFTKTPETTPMPSEVSPASGLVALVGLSTGQPCMLAPALDVMPDGSLPDDRRTEQLATMGTFYTAAYVDFHMQQVRPVDSNGLAERASAYHKAVQQTSTPNRPPAHQDRSPRAFRPSSSRTEAVLSGLPFNCHTATWQLSLITQEERRHAAYFYNITCGAPADHARGFGNIFVKSADWQRLGLVSPVGPVSGGLRRLEAKRLELMKQVDDLQTMLIMQVANYFVTERQKRKTIYHVPTRDPELQNVRWKLFEAVQSLHHTTWVCAVRRSNVFSQALGLALTCFLASLSDVAKSQSTWPDLWVKQGFLVTFEGMLSAAGKELGMIEDASVGIEMLKFVELSLVADDGAGVTNGRVPVVHSPYLKWVKISTTNQTGDAPTEYTVQLGILPSYYDQRIPSSFKNGAKIRLYPLLFEVGVDIRQWGAHAGSNLKHNLRKGDSAEELGSSGGKEPATASVAPQGLLDDEDDDVGVEDDDVLVQLNFEAFQKLNVYAHRISPANSQNSSQKIHPLLETLHQHIMSSSGKINHDILDEAATLSQQLGGGAVVFCKSGKDRTAMHVTYKQSQFANRYKRHWSPEANPGIILEACLDDAMLIRTHGTRLPICEKNVGQAKYAFNSLQVKFMPDKLKPPMNTLAGFLKGGKVFTGGGIES